MLGRYDLDTPPEPDDAEVCSSCDKADCQCDAAWEHEKEERDRD